jgi:uncharacterized protein (TIGR02996 family)
VSEDEAFVARLSARPDDETARLVYADWLDERDDPRGAYLRAEAAWIALQPQDEQYRPLYRELSRRAAALDPAWLVSASRVGHLVRTACEPGPSYTVPPQPDPRPALAELRALYAEAFGESAVAERFCLPVDYLAFLCAHGGANNGTTYYLSARNMASANCSNANIFRPARLAPDSWSDAESAERPAEPAMWIEFGGVTEGGVPEKRAHFVCADLGSPLFGVTAEGEDYHPWMAGIESLEYRGRNLLHFFDGYVRAIRGCDPWWNVPHAQWSTH